MSQTGVLSGKALLVTGAGRGIGRAIAVLAAAEGAMVVVNDLGGDPRGVGPADPSPADAVVGEIVASGGRAIANGDSVADPQGAQRMVNAALAEFGRLDCVVNNAGILRDRIFHHMSQQDWQSVIDVHLNGTFHVSRAAAGVFRDQQSGAFVHFTSTSGLIGSVGQANYAAAKMGIVGLSRSIALDMARYNVRSNCVSPFARSRLVGEIPPDEKNRSVIERVGAIPPETVAPIAVYLLSDVSREISGQIFVVRNNEVFLMSQPRPVRSVHRDGGWSVASLQSEVGSAFASALVPLERGDEVFNWDPI